VTPPLLQQWLASAFDSGDDAFELLGVVREDFRDDSRIPAEDQALLVQLRSADPEALRLLVDRYAARMARIARTYVGTRDDAQDVVQDVFIAIWERRDALVLRGAFGHYLMRATRNRALNVVRTERRAVQRAAAAQADESALTYNGAPERLDAADDADAFREAVQSLPERQREVLRLRQEQEMDYDAIAETLGIGVPSVHNLMSKAVRRLYTLFAGRPRS
jgi:RNA polymerase sigma-70 factor (ECF subfamily)